MSAARALALVAVVVAVAASTLGRPQADGTARTSITGRVVGADGKPIANATVRGSTPGSQAEGPSATTDEAGRFALEDLSASPYSVRANDREHVSDTEESTTYYHRGDTLTLRLVKGGVITGRVTDAAGLPVVAVTVRAVRIKNVAGEAIRPSDYGSSDATDDRGVYRIYGLQSGTYLVVAGRAGSQSWTRATSRDADAPTYYPSSSRDTAAPVVISGGQEAAGIDISYRGEPGHAIRGRFVGRPSKSGEWVNVIATRPGDVETLASAAGSMTEDAFTIVGVPDGEYELKATRSTGNSDDASYCVPKRVSVRGADVIGVVLELVPFGGLSGTVVLETKPDAETCDRGRAGSISEVVLTAVRTKYPLRPSSELETTVDAKSHFDLKWARAATYFLEAALPDARWYVRSITRGDRKPDSTRLKSASSDLARDGLTLSTGQKAEDLRIVIADGAASIKGTISPAKAGGAAPADARVYLVPAEDASADDGARYHGTWAKSDGTFELANLAPGSYRAVVRIEPIGADGLRPTPAYWDATERGRLRKDALAVGRAVELGRCQLLADLELVAPRARAAR